MVIRQPIHPAPPDLMTRHRFSRDDYMRMIELDVLGPDDHVELIDGEIVDMSPSSPKHMDTIARLNRAFADLWGEAYVLIQGTLTLSGDSVVDPDVLLLRNRQGGYADALPTPGDALLLIEVASTSLIRDQQVKARLYAQAGIPDYWIVDIDKSVILVHRKPKGDRYGDVQTCGNDAAISPIHFPGKTIRVGELLK